MEAKDIYKPDLTEDEARTLLAEALGCKPVDIRIGRRWFVIAPMPDKRPEERMRRAETKKLRQAVAQIIGALPGEKT